jgi:hypothetical protein
MCLVCSVIEPRDNDEERAMLIQMNSLDGLGPWKQAPKQPLSRAAYGRQFKAGLLERAFGKAQASLRRRRTARIKRSAVPT